MELYAVLFFVNFVMSTFAHQNTYLPDANERGPNYRPVSPYSNTNLNQLPDLPLSTPIHVPRPGNMRPQPSYTSTQTLPRPIDQHVLTRPTPVFDADVHFDEDVHYNVYRPVPEHDGFPQIISDQHVMPRPLVQGGNNQNNQNNYFNHGWNIRPVNQHGNPVHINMLDMPNPNPYPVQTLQRPETLPIRPTLPFEPEHMFPEDNGHHPLIMDHQTPVERPFYGGKPFSATVKPAFVILAKNVFINPPKFENHPKPNFLAGPLSAIRFDHGRDYHINPAFLQLPKPPVFNKDVYNTSPPKEVTPRPGLESTRIDGTTFKPSTNNHEQAMKDPNQSTSVYNTPPGTKPSNQMQGPIGQFHPLLSLMTTETPTRNIAR